MNTVHNIDAQGNAQVQVGNVVAPESRSLAALYITDPRLDKERLETTKGGLLRGSYKWILEHESFTTWRSSEYASEPLWIRGDPGKGKTMLLCGIIDELQQSKGLTLFFFCEASDSSRSNATAVLRGLIWLLLKKVPSLDAYLRESYDDAGKPLFEDKNAWFALSKILANILKDPKLKGAYFVIDALDECTVDRESLLQFIRTQTSTTPAKWLVSSRNEADIERHLGTRRNNDLESADLKSQISLEHAENAIHVSEAIAAYISSSTQTLDCVKYDEELSSKVRDYLQKHAEGTFLWIHLVIQQLRNENSWDVEQALEEMPDGLDKLYDRMLGEIRDLKRDSELCLELLSTVNLAQRPMHVLELGSLSGLPDAISLNIGSITTLIQMCGSFLTIKDGQVYIIHQSAKDYLEANFFRQLEEIESRHLRIGLRCIDAASNTVSNMYDLDYDEAFDEDVKPQTDLLEELGYACEFWVEHLCLSHEKSKEDAHDFFSDDGPVLEFLHEHFLHWLEALLLLGKLALSIPLVAQLLRTVQRFNGECRLATFLEDAEKFIRRHRALIERYPRQLYNSALVFSPAECQIVQSQWLHLDEWIGSVSGMRANEDAWQNVFYSRTTSGSFSCLTFSSDSKLLASASSDYDGDKIIVRIWELATSSVATVSVPMRRASSIAFSPNNDCIALGGEEIALCERSSGNYSHTQNLEIYNMYMMRFSRNGDIIVALVETRTEYLVVVWDIKSNTTRVIKEDYFDAKGIALEPFKVALLATDEGQNLCLDTRISLFDIESGVYLCAFSGMDDVSRIFAFSDNTIAVSKSTTQEDRITILHAGTNCDLPGLSVLQAVPGYVSKLEFSPNRKLVAGLAEPYDETASYICIWNAVDGTLWYTTNQPLSGLTISFSPNGDALACILDDNFTNNGISILTVDTLMSQRASNPSRLSLMVMSRSGKLLVAASDDNLAVWDTCKRKTTCTFRNVNLVTSAVFSHDDRKLAWISGNKVMLSEIPGSGPIQPLEHSGSAKCITFSSDNKFIICGGEPRDGSGEVSFWNANTRECVWTFRTPRPVECTALSGDGKKLAVYEFHSTGWGSIWLRDLETGSMQYLKRSHPATVTDIITSTDGSLVGLVERSTAVNQAHSSLWDVQKEELLEESLGVVGSVACFNLDGSHFLTNRGCAGFHTSSHTSSNESKPKASTCSGLYVDDSWVYLNGRKRLYITANYRPPCVAVSGDLVVLGYNSGGLMWLQFKCDGNEIVTGYFPAYLYGYTHREY